MTTKHILLSVTMCIAVFAGACSNPAAMEKKESVTEATEVAQVTTAVVQEMAADEKKIPYNIAWGTQIGSTLEDLCTAIVSDDQGNTVMAGFTQGDLATANLGQSDAIAARFDADGKLVWQIQSGTDKMDKATGVALDSKGNAYVLGITNGNMTNPAVADVNGVIFLQKIDVTGKILWTKQMGTDGTEEGTDIVIDAKDNLFVLGSTLAQVGEVAAGGKDVFVSLLNTDGDILKSYQFGTAGRDLGQALAVDAEGNIYVVSETDGEINGVTFGGTDVLVTKLNPQGAVVFSTVLGTGSSDKFASICVDAQQGIYIGGTTDGNLADETLGQGDAAVMKLDPKGNLVWQHQFGTDLWDGVHDIQMAKDGSGNILAGGCQNWAECQAFIRVFDTTGKTVSINEFTPEFSTCGRQFAQDAKGNIYHIGGTHGGIFGDYKDANGNSDIFLLKTSLGSK